MKQTIIYYWVVGVLKVPDLVQDHGHVDHIAIRNKLLNPVANCKINFLLITIQPVHKFTRWVRRPLQQSLCIPWIKLSYQLCILSVIQHKTTIQPCVDTTLCPYPVQCSQQCWGSGCPTTSKLCRSVRCHHWSVNSMWQGSESRLLEWSLWASVPVNVMSTYRVYMPI